MPRLTHLYFWCIFPEPSYILLEYVPHGNMQTYLRHIRTGSEAAYQNKAEFNKDNLTPTEILTFACQVTRGMEYLASKQVGLYSLNTNKMKKPLVCPPYHSCKEPPWQTTLLRVKVGCFQLDLEWSSFQFNPKRVIQIDFHSQKRENDTTRSREFSLLYI